MISLIYFLAIVIVLVIVLVLIYDNTFKGYFPGMWTGDKIFCKDSGIDNVTLYVEGSGDSNDYQCAMIINDKIYDFKVVSAGFSGYTDCAEVECTVTSTNAIPLPPTITVSIDKKKGILKITSDSLLYGIFYKNHELTNYFS